ncbi:TetR/AcrR family transcriptional regulator [Gleimia sp. 6138-11-ORH1]|uniref:TetR/AcrR family transcriptional regulator n=1 Tax=Gleimia sp. 6138-11-ORH1 TaxID=2973937 RepID=UPI0021674925|nr:TetR/AcrR family transcriptional regulator [Gleimia sp. 6138-11-ORH1]MCS4484719.1 TetR/AcrR family transcriptional regulator [Gleimia sp. 6138-11-ORH1]
MPKIVGVTIDEHRELTRQALFTALSNLLKEQSFETITMAQISRRAKVGRTAVYNHFADKETLLLELMSATTQQFSKILAEALEVVDDPLQKLRIYIRSQLELKHHYHLGEGLNLRSLAAGRDTSKLREHAQILDQILTHLLQLAHRAGEIQMPSPQTNSLIQACISGQLVPSHPMQKARVIGETEAFILRALGANEQALRNIDPRVSELKFIFSDDDEEVFEDVDEGNSTYLRCPVHVS